MPSHSETRQLPYTPAQMFDLVAAIEDYPRFLPWCKAARILSRDEGQVTADLIIGAGPFNEKFTSLVTLDRPGYIGVTYRSGPLSHLSNEWHFAPVRGAGGQPACAISFAVDFDFKSPLLRVAMNMFFDQALKRMVAAFEARAVAVYG